MIITEVECIMLRLPDVKPIGDGTQDTLIVRVHTDEGIVGTGECHTSPWVLKSIIEAPLSHVSARGLKGIVVGENPLDIRPLWDKMYGMTAVYGRRGAVVHAISAIDMALWDIMGKVTGQPVHRLLGGSRRRSVPAYASTLAPQTHDDAVREAQELINQGFQGIKLGWGGLGQDLDEDLRLVARLRKVLGDNVDLMIDVGIPMQFRDAVRLAQGLSDYKVFFLEEPLSPEDLHGYSRLTRMSSTPIACGEKENTRFGFRDLMEMGGVDIIQPDVARAGGFTECLRIADLAELAGVTVIPHCWSTDILLSATLHYIAFLKDCSYVEYCVVDNPIRRNVISKPIEVKDGLVRIPEEPGLGVELDYRTIERLRFA